MWQYIGEIVGFHVSTNVSLLTILRSFKSIYRKEINKQFIEWVLGSQSRFYDSGIRNEMEFERIKQYILNNPQNREKINSYNL